MRRHCLVFARQIVPFIAKCQAGQLIHGKLSRAPVCVRASRARRSGGGAKGGRRTSAILFHSKPTLRILKPSFTPVLFQRTSNLERLELPLAAAHARKGRVLPQRDAEAPVYFCASIDERRRSPLGQLPSRCVNCKRYGLDHGVLAVARRVPG